MFFPIVAVENRVDKLQGRLYRNSCEYLIDEYWDWAQCKFHSKNVLLGIYSTKKVFIEKCFFAQLFMSLNYQRMILPVKKMFVFFSFLTLNKYWMVKQVLFVHYWHGHLYNWRCPFFCLCDSDPWTIFCLPVGLLCPIPRGRIEVLQWKNWSFLYLHGRVTAYKTKFYC